MMKVRFATAAAAALFFAVAPAAAQDADQTVTFEVEAVNVISVSGNASLKISTATAGSALTQATHTSTTYSITTNETDRKITAALDLAMPAGVTLKVALVAPTGASAASPVTLSTTPQDVVTNISTLNESALGITYTLDATLAAGVVASADRTVTFTIVAGA